MILIKQKTRKMRFFGLHKCMRWLRRVPLCAALTVRGLGGRDESPTVMRWLLHSWGQWKPWKPCTPWTPRPSQGNPSFFGNFFSNFWIAFTVFLSLFLSCCASEGPTPNRITWPISHWLFVVAGKSWKGVLAISSASTGCLGRILKWRRRMRRMSDWNSV